MKIYITKEIPKIAETLLIDKGFQVEVRKKDTLISKEELIHALENFDGVISMLSDNLNKDVLKHSKKTKIIANYAVGYNNIDINFANSKEIVVTNTPDVLTESTAELAAALTLSAGRRIVEGDKFTRMRKFIGWGPLLLIGKGLDTKTVGIIGMGRIGQTYARMMKGFNTEIIYHSRTKKDVPYKFVSLNELFEKSDVISLHLPLTKESKHLITENEFNKMKDGVVFINTARGSIVNENHLVKALETGKVAYAGLDVFEFEPEIHKSLFKMENVVILPHIGSATEKSRGDMAELAAKNIINVLTGEKAITEV